MPRRKRIPLVTQHLENLSRDALERYQDILREIVHRRNGVYALYRGNRLYYVGLARNLRGRLKSHLRDRHQDSWDRFSVYLTIGDQHLRELETLLLRIVKPTGNSVSGKFAKSQDMRNTFRQKFRTRFQQELKKLFGTAKEILRPLVRKSRQKPKRGAELATVLSRPIRLKATYKGHTIRARARKNGTIRFKGKSYGSPSAAAKAATRRSAIDGWWFWKFERSPGYWVRLSDLRKQPI